MSHEFQTQKDQLDTWMQLEAPIELAEAWRAIGQKTDPEKQHKAWIDLIKVCINYLRQCAEGAYPLNVTCPYGPCHN